MITRLFGPTQNKSVKNQPRRNQKHLIEIGIKYRTFHQINIRTLIFIFQYFQKKALFPPIILLLIDLPIFDL